jgi:hypothetical protein
MCSFIIKSPIHREENQKITTPQNLSDLVFHLHDLYTVALRHPSPIHCVYCRPSSLLVVLCHAFSFISHRLLKKGLISPCSFLYFAGLSHCKCNTNHQMMSPLMMASETGRGRWAIVGWDCRSSTWWVHESDFHETSRMVGAGITWSWLNPTVKTVATCLKPTAFEFWETFCSGGVQKPEMLLGGVGHCFAWHVRVSLGFYLNSILK